VALSLADFSAGALGIALWNFFGGFVDYFFSEEVLGLDFHLFSLRNKKKIN
jgi:hypothetical protein